MRRVIAALTLLPLALASCSDGDKPGRGGGKRARTQAAGSSGHPDEIYGEKATASFKQFEPGEVVKGGQVVIPMLSDMGNFNPYLSMSASDYEVHSRTYPFVLEENADFHDGPPSFKPGLVDRWTIDGATIRMHIRDDAVWSDGVPVTSADVRFSWQAAASPIVAWPNTANVERIRDVEIVDGKNYMLHFTRPYLYMLKDAKEWRVLPKHVYGEIPFDEWKSYQHWDDVARVVSGPYKVVKYKHNEEFVLEPNERYWDKSLPRLQRIYYRILRSKQTIFDAVLAGELDLQNSADARNAKKILEHEDLYLYNHGGLIYDYLGWNCERPLFKDPRVRVALHRAINVDNMIETLLYGYGERMNGPFVSTQWARDTTVPVRAYDPDKAVATLRRLGWKTDADGWLRKEGIRFEFALVTNSGNERREQAIQLVQADLKRIGVKVNINAVDFNALGENLRRGLEDAWLGGWWLSSKVDLRNIFHSKAIEAYNFGRWRNAEADALIERARNETDLEESKKIWHRIHRIMDQDPPYAWLYELRAIHAVHKRFHNVEINANESFYNIREWFVPKARQGMTR